LAEYFSGGTRKKGSHRRSKVGDTFYDGKGFRVNHLDENDQDDDGRLLLRYSTGKEKNWRRSVCFSVLGDEKTERGKKEHFAEWDERMVGNNVRAVLFLRENQKHNGMGRKR